MAHLALYLSCGCVIQRERERERERERGVGGDYVHMGRCGDRGRARRLVVLQGRTNVEETLSVL